MEENIIKVVHCKTKDIFNQRFAEINVSPEEKDENPYYYYVIIIQDTGEVYTHGKIINSGTLNKLKTLIGNDSDKSARKIAEEEISKVIDNAPEMYDTLQEIAAWIEEHGDEVTEINNGITTNAQNISTISKHIAWNATDIIPNYKYYITKSEFIAEHPDYQNENSVVYNDIVYIHDVKEIYTHGRFYNEYATFDYTEFEDDDVYVSEYIRQTLTIASIINNYGIVPVQIKNGESFLGIGVATIYIDTKATVKNILCKTVWLDNWTDSENQKHVIFKAEYNEDSEVRYELIQKDYVFANHKTSHLIAQELTVNDQKLQLDGSIDTYVKGNGTLGKINEFLARDDVAKFANDLTGRNEATAEEFTFRPSAGNISIRDDSATIKRIKGNSIVWNQMCDFTNGVFTFGESSGIKDTEGYTITTNESSTSRVIFQFGSPIPFYYHKWLAIATIKSPIQVNIAGMMTQGFVPNTKCDIYSFYQSDNRNWYWGLTLGSVGTISEIKVYNYLLFDLTQMFGVGNEPDTVEEFRALFPDNHYEYNPGQLVSMTANGLFTNGFNQWDEEWVNGYYRIYADSGVGNDGGFVENSSYIATAKPMKVLPNTQYYIKSPYGVLFGECDINGIYTGNHYYVYAGSTFTTSSNCFYLLFYVDKAITNATYINNICINLSHTGVENGKYEPYWDATKDLSIIQKYFPNGMRSAGSIYDEISFDETTQKWVAIQRVGNVDLGSLSWFASTATPTDNVTNRFFYAQINGLQLGYGTITISAPYDAIDSHPNSIYSKDKTIYCSENYVGGNSPTAVIIRDSSYNDAASFKSAMSGVMLNYELAEPIITVIEEPVNLSYKVGDFGIEQILSDSFSAPFRADIIYQFNATDRIRENSLNIEKLSKTQNEYLLLAGGTMSGQINSQDIKPVEDSTYQLGDSTHKYDNVFSNFFTGDLEGNAKTATVATDLSGRVEATPEVFTYRPSAGEKSIKDDNAFIRRVKGNSVAFNQLVKGSYYSYTQILLGLTCSQELNSRELKISGTYITGSASADYNWYGAGALTDGTVGIVGHKYLCHISGNKECSLTVYGWCSNSTDIFDSIIKECTSAKQLTMAIKLPQHLSAGTTVDETIIIDIHDLTQMFGAGNEPTTVEKFRELYPDSYYPYNTGELRNLVCSGIKTIGFNQWDEQWENSYIVSTTGQSFPSTNVICSKNFIPVVPNKTYYFKSPSSNHSHVYEYDKDFLFIGVIWSKGNNIFTTSPNSKYIKITVGSTDAPFSTYNNDICINLHHTGWRDGDYEPYKEVTHALPLSEITNGEPLRKAGSVYDEINETEYIKRVGVVDLGSLTYRKSDNFPNLFISNPFGAAGTDADKIANLFCPKYITMTAYDPWKDIISMGMDTSNQLYIYDPQYTDIEAFKSAMSGVILNYELAEPIVTPITTPIDFNYYVEDFGTEEALLAEDSAPFSADIIYQFNATDQIRNNTRNIDKLQKSAFTPSGTSSQYIRGDGSYGNVLEFTQAIPINDGEYEMPDAIHQFILTPNYYAKSPVELDNTTTVTVYVTPPEDSNYLAEYWFEFKTGEVLPDITFTSSTEDTKFRIAGDMLGDAVNILHLISSDGGMTFFGEMKHYIL